MLLEESDEEIQSVCLGGSSSGMRATAGADEDVAEGIGMSGELGRKVRRFPGGVPVFVTGIAEERESDTVAREVLGGDSLFH